MRPATIVFLTSLAVKLAFSQTPPCTIQTIAGPTSFFSGDGGPATAAYFHSIGGFRFDQTGNLFIADTGNQRIRKVTSNGIATTIAGTGVPGFSGDGGPATSAQLSNPLSVSPDNQGNLYILDGDSRVRKIDSNGVISTFAGNGTANFAGDGGPATAAEIQTPADVLADSKGNVFIADAGNYRVRVVNPQGIISTFAGSGFDAPSPGLLGGPAIAYYLYPTWLAIDDSGNLYICDRSFDGVLKVDGSGLITAYAGGGKSNSPVGQPATSAYFNATSISFDSNGNMALASLGSGVFEIPPSGIVSQVSSYSDVATIAFNQNTLYYLGNSGIYSATTNAALAGGNENGNSGDGGPATSARFLNPSPIAVDLQGNVYVVDQYAGQVRKIGLDGTITHVAGTPTGETASGDGGPAAQAGIGYTMGIAVDDAGNIYLSDYLAGTIRKINAQGIIATLSLQSSNLMLPSALAVDPTGNIYVQTFEGVVEVLTTGSTVALRSYIDGSVGWTVDRQGNFYSISNVEGPATLVKKAPDGTTTEIQLPQVPGAALYSGEFGVAVDASGNVFIATNGSYPSSTISEVTPDGRAFTIARGDPSLPYTTGHPGQVDLGVLSSLVIDTSGDLFFGDFVNWTVRELTAGCPAVVQPLIATNGVVNAASYDTGLAAGEIVAVFGNNLGPPVGEVAPVTGGYFPIEYAGVSITVNGYPAPVLYVSQNQTNFVLPFEVEGQGSRLILINYNGIASDAYYLTEGFTADPGIFVVTNPDFSANSASNPVNAGSYVVVYGTGAGPSNPPEVDGEIMGDALAAPMLAITATIDGQAASVLYAGSAPGLVAGILQVNLAVPGQLTSGQHTFWISAGTANSQQVSLFTQ